MRISNLLIILVLFLSGCNSTGTRTQNIVSFTDILVAESPNLKITIPARKFAEGRTNISKLNLDVKDIGEKPKFKKIYLSMDISAEPLIIDNKIYAICADGSLHAYDLTTHKKVWVSHLLPKKTKDRIYGGGIAYENGRLYVTHGSQYLYIINAENGRKIASKNFGDVLAKAPYINGDLIYILTLNNQLYAVTKDNFVLVWDHSAAPEKLTYGANHSSISLDYKNRIFVTYSSGQIFLLDPLKGVPLWQYDLSLEQNMPGLFPVNVIGDPILDKNFAYIADSSGKVYKFNFENDKKIWDRKISDVQTLNKVGGALLVTTNGRQAAALDDSNGKVIWATDIVNDIDDVTKQDTEYKNVAAYNKKEQDSAILKSKKPKKPKGKVANFFDDFKRRAGLSSSSDKPKTKEAKIYYERGKVKPIKFVRAVVANDFYQLYTAKGDVYYISVKNGALVDQNKLKQKLDYVTFSREVILSGGKKILFNK